MMNQSKENLKSQSVPVATLGPPHGLKGEVRVYPFHGKEFSQLKKELKVFLQLPEKKSLNNSAMPLMTKITSLRWTPEYALVFFDSFTDRDQIKAFQDSEVWMLREDFKELENDNEYYLSDLLGFEVQHFSDSKMIGLIESFYFNGANQSVAKITSKEMELEVLLIPQFIKRIDWEKKVVVIDNPIYE